MKVLIVFYSMYGHIYAMAKAAAEGVAEVEGVRAELKRVPETLPEEVLAKMGAIEPQKAFADVPVATVQDLVEADGIIFGTPTRFGNMCGQMRQFFDATGGIWSQNALVGKPGGVISSSGTQHGGQETTIITTQITMLHHGMIIVGLPYSFQGQRRIDEMSGCSPYGPSTIVGPDGARMPSENELEGTRYFGRRMAHVVQKLAG